MSDIKDRLLQFAKTQGLNSLGAIEKECGFNKNTITKQTVGMNTTNLVKIVEKFPQLNLDWLIMGRGEMFSSAIDEGNGKVQSSAFNVENVQAVFITNWADIAGAMEKVVAKAMEGKK